MDERTLTALHGSIAKWEGIVAGTEYDGRSSNCALCKEFDCESEEETEDDDLAPCDGCPVKSATGLSGCARSPWEEWNLKFEPLSPYRHRVADTPERVAAAQAELDFLISLLPTETPNT